MKELKKEVSGLVEAELARAVAKYGKTFASIHEAYAVILEEVEEAGEPFEAVKMMLSLAWNSIKFNHADYAKDKIKLAKRYAIEAAAELIQVAAMCEKAAPDVVCGEEAKNGQE